MNQPDLPQPQGAPLERPLMAVVHAPFPLSTDVLVLSRANQAFVQGTSRQIVPHTTLATYFMVILAVTLTFPCAYFWVTSQNLASTLLLIFPAAVVVIILALVNRHRTHQRLVREGRLVLGTLLDCSGSTEMDSEGGDYVAVTLRYTFITPQGQRVMATEQLSMLPRIFKKTSLPATPAPVAVLYAGDSLFKLM